MEATQMTSDVEALKTKLRATWIAGDFGEIAKSYATGAEDFVRSLNLQPGTRVLDVACGTGNLALPAARLGAVVTGVDIAPNLIEQARENASREGLAVQFDEGDVENLPYAERVSMRWGRCLGRCLLRVPSWRLLRSNALTRNFQTRASAIRVTD